MTPLIIGHGTISQSIQLCAFLHVSISFNISSLYYCTCKSTKLQIYNKFIYNEIHPRSLFEGKFDQVKPFTPGTSLISQMYNLHPDCLIKCIHTLQVTITYTKLYVIVYPPMCTVTLPTCYSSTNRSQHVHVAGGKQHYKIQQQ